MLQMFDAAVVEGSSNIVLSAQGVATGGVHLGAACCQYLAKVGGFGLHVNREGDLKPAEGFGLGEILLQTIQKRHMGAHPVNFKLAGLPEVFVPDFAHGKRFFFESFFKKDCKISQIFCN